MTTLPLWELPEDSDAGLTAVEAELYRLDPDLVNSVIKLADSSLVVHTRCANFPA